MFLAFFVIFESECEIINRSEIVFILKKGLTLRNIVIEGVFIAFLLAACGDDSSSSSSEETTKSSSVATYGDLAHCTKSHYGEIMYVEDEGTYYECTSEDWVEVDSATVDSILATSSSSADADTVKSSSSVKADSSEIAEVETKKVDSVTVSGFAHKGPFESGATVTVYGLDSLLEKTKTKFSGKVSGDSGAFSVSKIVLPSQFALVEVNGFYMNENTGKKTSGTKTTLSALVDLSEGKSVKANVNVFTDFEYARAKQLVLKEKFNVPAAKKRATKELLAAFGGKGGDDLTATSLSLSDTNSAGTALLFASVLLQGDLSASKFGSRLGDVADLFASTGSLDSDTLRAALADWASKTDSVDNFAAIRKNVKNMKLATVVPDFEKVLYTFWTAEYKLGTCTDSLEETLKKNENKLSENYGAGYVCTSKRWHKATALDSELGLCLEKTENTFKEYKGGKETEYYVCKSGTWNKITETQYELKECSESRENEYVATKSGEYFVCSAKQWVEVDSVAFELKLCTEKRNLELTKAKDGVSYVCEWDGSKGAWRKASDAEAELGAVCGDKNNPDSTFKQGDEKIYVCLAKEWNESDGNSFELKKLCGSSNENAREKSDKNNYFVCQKNGDEWGWNSIDSLSYELGLCTEDYSDGFVKSGNAYYACVKDKQQWGWTAIDAQTYEFGFCTEELNSYYREATNGDKWFCVDKKWTLIEDDDVFAKLCSNVGGKQTCKVCNYDVAVSFLVYEGYICWFKTVGDDKEYYWREATDAELATGEMCRRAIEGRTTNGWTCTLVAGSYVWK